MHSTRLRRVSWDSTVVESPPLGLEPGTECSEVRRTNQLSYTASIREGMWLACTTIRAGMVVCKLVDSPKSHGSPLSGIEPRTIRPGIRCINQLICTATIHAGMWSSSKRGASFKYNYAGHPSIRGASAAAGHPSVRGVPFSTRGILRGPFFSTRGILQ